ncbi:MAG: type II secretion system protein [Kineosporiaceae bacterium]
MSRRLRGLRARRDEGVSLIELLVVMMIFSVLLAIVFSVLIIASRDTRDNAARNEQVTQVRLGMMEIDRQVRSGNVISDPAAETTASSGVAANYSLRVYTQTDGVYHCVQWRVRFPTGKPGLLEERSWTPLWASTGEVTTWRVVARDVVAPTGTAPKPFQKVTAAGGSKAQSIQVSLQVLSAGSRGRSTSLTSVLTGRNTVYGYPADECASIPPP